MSNLPEQIDALVALNAKGAVSHPVPGLAIELLTRAAAELRSYEGPVVMERMVDAGLAEYSEGGCMGLDQNERREVVTSILTAALQAKP